MSVAKDRTDLGTLKDRLMAFGLNEATYYRWLKRDTSKERNAETKRNAKRLTEDEESRVLEVLTSDRFIDCSPEEVFYTLLDEGEYLCSTRTMYRVLNRHKAVKERRNQRVHPEYKKPELLATGPNQLWSWDITKIRTGKKWTYHYLYVILDVYSRYVVGWLIAPQENASLAEKLIMETCEREGIQPDQLTIHADRGSAMTSKTVSQLMADLGVKRTHSRPHVSNDNPYSEAQFKTLKYHWSFPKKFPEIQDAKKFLDKWFIWYNNEHRHSGIQMMTPECVHHGKVDSIRQKREKTLAKAYRAKAWRFSKGKPKLPPVIKEVWINKPAA